MPYTTEFEGHFILTPLPSAEVVAQLMDLAGANRRESQDVTMPASRNQWVLTRDRQRLTWQGGPAFTSYVPWLQWLVTHVLTPAGITVAGSVHYQGEEATDAGVLTVEDGRVRKRPAVLLDMQDLAEMQQFVTFVLSSRYGEGVLREWQRARG